MGRFLAYILLFICPAMTYVKEGSKMNYTEKQEYLFHVIKNRRTVRNFKSTPVPDEHIIKILDAAHFAPTAGNQQPWKFLVIRDREKLDSLQERAHEWFIDYYSEENRPDREKLKKIKKAVKVKLEKILSAPVYVAILVDSKAEYPEYIIHDGTLAAGYMMIAARALGYGTGFFTTYFPEDKMKKFFDIPDRYRLICFSPIGVPERWPETPKKKEIEELVVFESFSEDR